MSSFKGRLSMSEEEACWDAVSAAQRPTGTWRARGASRPTTRSRRRGCSTTSGAASRSTCRSPTGTARYQQRVAAGLRRLGSLRRSARDDLREVRGAAAGQGDARRRAAAIDRGQRLRQQAAIRRWVDTLERLLPPLRYLYHGLQMLAAYVGQMAPSGRITIAAALQAADEMRRVQRIAYRMAMLRRLRPGFGDVGQAAVAGAIRRGSRCAS